MVLIQCFSSSLVTLPKTQSLLIAGKRVDGSIFSPKALAQSGMQTASTRNWNRVADSIAVFNASNDVLQN